MQSHSCFSSCLESLISSLSRAHDLGVILFSRFNSVCCSYILSSLVTLALGFVLFLLRVVDAGFVTTFKFYGVAVAISLPFSARFVFRLYFFAPFKVSS
jgi:hypothetical protein